MINKTSWKFIAGFLVLIAVGIAILLFGLYADPEAREERVAKQYLDDLRAQYENDPYGGDTPEETLALFIEALERGDVELASKYFVIDEQEEWRGKLVRIKEEDLLNEMIKDLQNKEEDKIDNDTARYFIFAQTGQAATLVLIKTINDKWKIRTL